MAKIPPTQSFLEFEEIIDGVIILKDSSLRSIIMVSSLNFALRSNEEQDAILEQFQSFLNSLDFSCQILVQSRRLNFTSYLEKFKEIEEKEENELLRMQISEYRSFIASIISEGTIMQKSFYLIIPFSLGEAQSGVGVASAFKTKLSPLTEEQFQRAKTQLLQRVEFVVLGLRRCDLQAVPLNTKEIIELLWSSYHPEEAEKGHYPEIPSEFLL